MTVTDLRDAPAISPVAVRFLDIVAAGDSTALLDLFAPNAVVRDWGQVHAGPTAIAAWNAQEFLGAGTALDVRRVVEIDGRVFVSATVSSRSYRGPGTFVVVPNGEHIRELLITG